MDAVRRSHSWIALVALPLLLVACGGGGGDAVPVADASPQVPAAPAAADPRNGTYPLYASHGKAYALSLDFDARTWRVAGPDVDQAGTLGESAGEFHFLPAGSSVDGTSTARFTLKGDAALGSFPFPLPSGTPFPQVFIAPRTFLRSLAEVEGRYAWFTASRSSGNRPVVGNVGQAHLRDGRLEVPAWFGRPCASASGSDPVTVSGEVFTWHGCAGAVPFRVARIGSDKVLLAAFGPEVFPTLVLAVHEAAIVEPGRARMVFSDGGGRAEAEVSAQEYVLGARRAPVATLQRSIVPQVRTYGRPTEVQQPSYDALRTRELTVVAEPLWNMGTGSLGIGWSY